MEPHAQVPPHTHVYAHEGDRELLMPSKFHVMSHAWEDTKYVCRAQLTIQSNLGLILSQPKQDKKVARMKHTMWCYYVKHVASNRNCLFRTSYYLLSLLYFMSKNSLGHMLFVLRVTCCSLSLAKHWHLHKVTDVKIWAFRLLLYLFFKLR